jgi:hypothetical protein
MEEKDIYILNDKYGISRDESNFSLCDYYTNKQTGEKVWKPIKFFPTIESLCVQLIDISIISAPVLEVLKIGDMINDLKITIKKTLKHNFVIHYEKRKKSDDEKQKPKNQTRRKRCKSPDKRHAEVGKVHRTQRLQKNQNKKTRRKKI